MTKLPPAHAEFGRQCNTQNISQPNQVHEQMGHPVQSSGWVNDNIIAKVITSQIALFFLLGLFFVVE